jgi:very-short-patch-repair endonuclease
VEERLSVSKSYRQSLTIDARQLRRDQTKTEEQLWYALRNRKLAARKFKRQHRIGPFIVDFFCPGERLIVEIDGPIHRGQRAADRERQRILESGGYRVFRVTTTQVETDLDTVLSKLLSFFTPSPRPAATPLPLQRERGRG